MLLTLGACFLGQIEGPHERIVGPCSPTEYPLRPARGMVTSQANKGPSLGITGPKSNSDLQFTQACKGNSQANSGLLSLTRASQSSTGLPLADKMPSWTKCQKGSS